MAERNIFRKKPLHRITSPEDLDEMLRVNSSHTWLLFVAICFVIVGIVIWSFFASITQYVNGFGIVKVQELPRAVIANNPGQVDAIFCKTGDRITAGQKLMNITLLESQKDTFIQAPFSGEVTGMNVREGDYIAKGASVIQLLKENPSLTSTPEVLFFVSENDVHQLKTGMNALLKTGNGAIPADLLTYRITFIATYPASKELIRNISPRRTFHCPRRILFLK